MKNPLAQLSGIRDNHTRGKVADFLKEKRLILGFEDMLPAAIKCPGVTPARPDRGA
jgi:hypothetical protein